MVKVVVVVDFLWLGLVRFGWVVSGVGVGNVKRVRQSICVHRCYRTIVFVLSKPPCGVDAFRMMRNANAYEVDGTHQLRNALSATHGPMLFETKRQNAFVNVVRTAGSSSENRECSQYVRMGVK